MPTLTISRQWRLIDDQYFKDETNKTQIVLHHTVGGTARSTFEYWQGNPDRIATSYIIDRDGTIYEVFDPLYWAFHLGLKLPKNIIYNQCSIGIELASEGPLRSGKELNSQLTNGAFNVDYLYAFDIDVKPFKNAVKLYHLYNDQNKFFNCTVNFRGYGFFDLYDEPQIVSTIKLVKHLCEQFSIPRILIPNKDKLEFDLRTLDHKGIITHANCRKDKTDLSPAWDWDRFEKELTS